MADKKDDRDYVQKTLDGDVASFNTDDTLDALSSVSRGLPGKAGDLAAAVIEPIHGSVTSERKLREMREKIGRDPRALAKGDNRALRRAVDKLNGLAGSKFMEYSTRGAGAIVGGGVGSAMVPIPLLGSMGGAWLGDEAAQILYDEVARTQDQDAVGLADEMRSLQSKSQAVSPEYVFAALASNLPDAEAKKVEDRLFALTGHRKFTDAIADGQTNAITTLMREFDMDIRVDTHLPYDPNNVSRTASEEYAELINTAKLNGRKMDPYALLVREDMPSIMEITRVHMERQDQPAQPRLAFRGGKAVSDVARGMNKMGVVAAVDADQPVNILPISSGKPGSKNRAG